MISTPRILRNRSLWMILLWVVMAAFVGFFDSAVVALVIVVAHRTWSTLPQSSETSPPAGLLLVASVLALWVANICLLRGPREEFIAINAVLWMLPALFGPPLLLRMLRRHLLPAPLALRAVAMGLLTGGIWVGVGAVFGLQDYLRFSPLALRATAGIGVLMAARVALSRRKDPQVVRMFVLFLIAQSTAALGYVNAAVDAPQVMLRYAPSDDEATSSHGLRAVVVKEGDSTLIRLDDPNSNEKFTVAKIETPVAGVDLDWTDEGVFRASWVTPAPRFSFDCSGEHPRIISDMRKSVTARPCLESNRPLLCLMGVRDDFDRCSEDAHCQSHYCAGVCLRRSVGDGCSSDESCWSRRCVGRRCEEPLR